jgi:hypothetical protein
MANIEKLKLRAARPRRTLAAHPLSSHFRPPTTTPHGRKALARDHLHSWI